MALMGTVVTMQVGTLDASREQNCRREEAVERAFEWFRQVERACTRFETDSEVMRFLDHVGEPIAVSSILFECVQFALVVAEESGGAFDPTVGCAMETRGFNKHYRTGRSVHTGLTPDDSVSYRDVQLNPDRRTITLLRPLILDLGAVAKGLAIDLAAQELRPFGSFMIDAGGDLYLGGCRPNGEPWSVGIRHPRREGEFIDVLRVCNKAVCTSGDYERKVSSGTAEHHIVDPRTGVSPNDVASVTVVAPTAMSADTIATAAFVLGLPEGLHFLGRSNVDGVIVSSRLEKHMTRGIRGAL